MPELHTAIAALAAPPKVGQTLERLCRALSDAAGKNLVSIAVYGGLAAGHFREGKSDVDLALVLEDASTAALERLAPPLRAAAKEARVDPIVLTRNDLQRAADVFPTKFLSLQRHHRLLFGEEVFAQLAVSREHLRLRLEQELRNLVLRLRRRYLAIGGDARLLERALEELVGPVTAVCGELLVLLGREPKDATREAVLGSASQALGLGEALVRLVSPEKKDPKALAAEVLAALEKAAGEVDRLSVQGQA